MALPLILAPLFTAVDTSVIGFFLSAASRIAAAAVTPFKTLVTVYIFLWGLAMWRGLIEEPLSDAVGRIFRIVLIGSLALGMGYYGPYIATSIYKTPPELASVVIGGTATPEVAMDSALNSGNDIALSFISLVGLAAGVGGSIAAALSALVVWIFTALVVFYGAALILLSKVALGLILALGPIFIALMLFDATKNFFTSWIGQALNYLFIYALVAGTVMIMFALWLPQLNYALVNNAAGFSALIPMIIVGGAAFVILMQITGIASGLAGGVHIQTLGAMGWAANKLGSARKATLRRDSFRRADGSRGAEWRGAAPATARGVGAAGKYIAGRMRGGNSVAAK